MVQRWNASRALLLGVCLLDGCLGGQTGHPDSYEPPPDMCSTIDDDQPVQGVTARQLLQSLYGQHDARLRWQSGVASAFAHEQVGDEDAISVEMKPLQSTALNCSNDLQVQLAIDVTTRDTGFSDSGMATARAPHGALMPVSLDFTGTKSNMQALFSTVPGGTRFSGTFVPNSGEGRTGWAQFSDEPVGAGGAGGNQ